MLQSLVTIALLHWAVLLVPGFNFVLIGQLAASGSRRGALAAVVGMTTATLIWAVLAVAGVGAVFSAHPMLRLVAQVGGGLYLLYLAVGLFRAGGAAAPAEQAVQGGLAAFRAGFVTSALNPKIALFYGSVFATALPAQPRHGWWPPRSPWSMPTRGSGMARWPSPCRSPPSSVPTWRTIAP